ncbi:glycosyltransferase family 4 protein [Natronohydrobacter thiooxidans]|uniref:glycosyltransferase family 4 protein n=1 Tax=Natronohydrobacter thiooxidans TaxID=87172 RepID=UPI0008FF4D65|nr:glycosyltransferase family 4 protein [Natronohydrobacter thiooxidans]
MRNPGHRILVTSHGHPDFHLGGGELAAYNLYKAYSAHPDVEAAFFLARHDRGRGPTGAFFPRRENEFLWEQGVGDWFRMKMATPRGTTHNLAELIRHLRPTIVHVHHYVHMGLEYLHMIKQIDPSIRIVMTLHEYIAICFNQGQMVKPGTNRLCFRESPDDCNRCFPQHSIEDFWLRKHRYQSFFRLVDQFVAPSDFLRQRYIDWGIAPERIVTIENGQASGEILPPRPLAEGETRNRFAFFGQINPFKGVSLLLQGLASLKKSERRKIVLEIHGANLEEQTPEFRDMIMALRGPLEKEGCLQWIGPYEPFQMAGRMAAVDWVVIPSIWWENSPMVIQEAFSLGRPLVGSDIGGMAEKITHGLDGVHVPVGNAKAWGETLLRLSGYTEEWDRLRAGITKPISYADCARAHLELV